MFPLAMADIGVLCGCSSRDMAKDIICCGCCIPIMPAMDIICCGCIMPIMPIIGGGSCCPAPSGGWGKPHGGIHIRATSMRPCDRLG